MLKVKNLSVGYGKHSVLKDVSFSVKAGSFTAVLGKNGAGKSTLFSALGGALPYKGEINLGGAPLASFSPRERALNMCVLPQHLSAPAFTVRELAEKGRAPHLDLRFRLGEDDRAAAKRAVERMELGTLCERRLNTLSGGERQLAYLAAMLATEAPLLCLDEPTSFLDIDRAERVLDMLSSLTSEGKSVLAAMHDISSAVRYADHILILESGSVRFFGSTEECLAACAPEQSFSLHRYEAEGRLFFGA